MRYTVLGLLGGVVGLAVAWTAMPASTLVDDAWRYVWLGLAAGAVAGLLFARKLGARSR